MKKLTLLLDEDVVDILEYYKEKSGISYRFLTNEAIRSLKKEERGSDSNDEERGERGVPTLDSLLKELRQIVKRYEK